MRHTPDNITTLKPEEIFVFGSNLNGAHLGGAARAAIEHFGAIFGQAVGLQGQSYAIPTLGHSMQKMPLADIEKYVAEFLVFARKTPAKTFLVTQIGTGIAGFTADEIAPFFFKTKPPTNVTLPATFHAARPHFKL